MSQQLIGRDPVLKRLRDDGYDVDVVGGHLILREVPYVNSQRQVQRGVLVSTLAMSGDTVSKPDTHVAMFAGEHPCHKDGRELAEIKHSVNNTPIAPGLVTSHSFSAKPKSGAYADYYEKMTTYAAILSSPAAALDPTATPRTFPVVLDTEGESPHHYIDTASSRAGITAHGHTLALARVSIVGVGGTGGYVLDLVAKTLAKQIDLFDGDTFANHNAFRAPGAATIEELRAAPAKVDYYCARYSKMHRNIVPHQVFVDASNVALLLKSDFVFVCIDDGEAKQVIIKALLAAGVSFVDVGMGIQLGERGLFGHVRVTTGTSAKQEHLDSRISFGKRKADGDYAQNIQVADLNALNAALAVVKWKKHFGFYADTEKEHHCTYDIDGNHIQNEDVHEPTIHTHPPVREVVSGTT